MNQTKASSPFSIRSFLISVAIQGVILFVGSCAVAGLLIKLSRFENYFSLSAWAVLLLTALAQSLYARTKGQYAGLFALASSLIFAIICLGIGLLAFEGPIRVVSLILWYGAYVLLSEAFTLLWSFLSGKRRRTRKFHFSK